MTNTFYENMENEIINDKLKEGYAGIKFLFDIAGDINDDDSNNLKSILNTAIGEFTDKQYFTFAIQAFSEEKIEFESRYDVPLDVTRKLLLKVIANEVNETEHYKPIVIQKIVEKMKEYKKGI